MSFPASGLANRHPTSDSSARSHPTVSKQSCRVVTRSRGSRSVGNSDRIDQKGNLIKAVAGYDVMFSAPKSVSVLRGLTGDEGFAECHDRAVDAAIEIIEKYGSTTRIRSNGTRLHPETRGLTIGAFLQSTSRADDPQLHTHVVISSKVQTADGRWYVLDGRVLKRHQQAFGYFSPIGPCAPS